MGGGGAPTRLTGLRAADQLPSREATPVGAPRHDGATVSPTRSPNRARCSSWSSRTAMSRSRRAVRCRPPSVPSRPSMYSRISGAKRSRLKKLADAGAGHPVPPGELRSVLDLAGVDQPPPLAGAGEGINNPGPSGTLGTFAWPASMARSRRGWHAARFPRLCRQFWVARSTS